MASISIEDIRLQRARGSVTVAARDVAWLDEDISWLLDGLAARALADGGLITHHRDGVAPRTLASAGMLRPEIAGIVELIEAASAVAEANARRMHGPDPLVVWCGLRIDGVEGRVILMPIACGDGEQAVVAALYRTDSSIATDVAEARAMRMQPMLAGYFRLWGKARAQACVSAGLEAALDASADAVALLDKAGEVRFLNRAMRRIVDEGDGLRLRGQTLVATDLTGSMRLQGAIGQALADPDQARLEPRALALFLPRPKKQEPLAVAVMAAIPFGAESEAAAVVVHAIDPAADLTKWVRPACQAHGLSPVESNLVLQLLTGASLTEAAETLRLKEQTARSYLKQIFGKTGVSRQSDLIRLMMANALRIDRVLICVPV